MRTMMRFCRNRSPTQTRSLNDISRGRRSTSVAAWRRPNQPPFAIVSSSSWSLPSSLSTLSSLLQIRTTALLDPQDPNRLFHTSAATTTASAAHVVSASHKRRRSASVFSQFHNIERVWHAGPGRFMPTATIREKEEWLQSLLETSEDTVDTKAFLVVLEALASQEAIQDAGAPRRAEMWMNRLRNLENRCHNSDGPQDEKDRRPTSTCSGSLALTAECYQHVIQAWANSDKEQLVVIVNRSERWFDEIMGQNEGIDGDLESNLQHNGASVVPQPTIQCVNAFLDACTRGRPGRNKKNHTLVVQNAKKAEAILRRLNSLFHHSNGQAQVVPNTDSFNFVIRGWTRCKQDDTIGDRVLALVRLMESHQREDPWNIHVRPNTKTYSMAMDALVSVAKQKAHRLVSKERKVLHRRAGYRQVDRNGRTNDESEWKNDTDNQNGVKEMKDAEAILKYMHDLYDAGVEGVVPNKVPYNILVTGWAGLAQFGHHDAQFKAEEILRIMISHRDRNFTEAAPDRVSYEKVITAWSNSDHPNAGKRASWWLKQLWKESENHPSSGDNPLEPTVSTYNAVMRALAKTDGASAAENMLLDLGEIYRDQCRDNLRPNSESFAVVIRAWLKACDDSMNTDDRISSLHRAVEWLSSLREIENENNLSSAPDLFSGVLMSAIVCARERESILDLARKIFEDFRQSRHRVDHIAYAALLQVGLQTYARGHNRENKLSFVYNLFEECCEDGLLSNTFVRALYDDHSDECDSLIESFFHHWPLPVSWSRNVVNPIAKPSRFDAQRSYERNATRHRKRSNF